MLTDYRLLILASAGAQTGSFQDLDYLESCRLRSQSSTLLIGYRVQCCL